MIKNKDVEDKEKRVIFMDVLRGDLPPEEKTVERMWHDAQLFNIAGAETTSWTLANCTFYLLTNPDILRKLQDELKTVMPDGTIGQVTSPELETLPYLVRGVEAY